MKILFKNYYKSIIQIILIIIFIYIITFFYFIYSPLVTNKIYDLKSKTFDGYIEISWQYSKKNKESKGVIEIYCNDILQEKVECNLNLNKYVFEDGNFGEVYNFKVYEKQSIGEKAETSSLFINYDKMPNIPLIVINTSNDIEPKYTRVDGDGNSKIGNSIINNDYVSATFVLYEGNVQTINKKGKIKIRGNATAALLDKKPYKIKFNESIEVDLKNNKIITDELLLLSDVGTTLNHPIGIQVSKICGQKWEPSYRYANLIINGKYKGCYILSETLKNASSELMFNSYLAEYDVYYWNSNNNYFKTKYTPKNMGYTIKYPYDIKQVILEAESDINEYEDDLFSRNCLDKIDIDSFSSWMLIHDVLGTYDTYGTNLFIYKKDNKLFLGPCWDFGCTLVETNNWSGMHYNNQLFNFYKLLNNELFIKSYENEWINIKEKLYDNLIEILNGEIIPIKEDLNESWLLDSKINMASTKSVDQLIFEVNSYFENRIAWINNNIEFININSDWQYENN